MATDIDKELVTHEIDAYLYPIHLPGNAEGKYMAKTKSGTPLSVENICAAAVELSTASPEPILCRDYACIGEGNLSAA